MNQPAFGENPAREVGYFENYEANVNDINTLQEGIDTLAGSGLLEEGVLDNIRFVTHDSKYLYVITRGEHRTNGKFHVQKMPSGSKSGFNLFMIPCTENPLVNYRDYSGAIEWFLRDEIEKTAVNAKRFPNTNPLGLPDSQQPPNILDVIRIAPFKAYNKIHREGEFNYLTDCIFHEAGHIEHRRLQNWQHEERKIETFPTEEQREIFLSVVRQNKIFPSWFTQLIIQTINGDTIDEMYAMLIDREGAKRYDDQKFSNENAEFEKLLLDLGDGQQEGVIKKYERQFRSGHVSGRFLVRILEEQFPDFIKRKAFVRSILDRSVIKSKK